MKLTARATTVTATAAMMAGLLMPMAAAGPAAAQGSAWHGRPDDTVTATIPVGFTPQQVAVNTNTNTVYVTGTVFVSGDTSQTVAVISGATHKLIATVPLGVAVGERQGGIAVNPRTNRIYVAWGTRVKVLSGRTNKVMATITGKGLDAQMLAVNPATNTIYATDIYAAEPSAVSVINGWTNKVVATVPEPLLPQGIAVNPRTNRIYVTCGSNSSGATVSVIHGATHKIIKTIPIGLFPAGITVNPQTNIIYALTSDTVTMINGWTNKVVTTFEETGGALGIAVNPRTALLYTAEFADGNVIAFIAKTGEDLAGVDVNSPLGIAVNPRTNTTYVTNLDDETVAVLTPSS